MGVSAGPDIIEDGLVLALDAADKNSYPGSGTTWYDLSENNNSGTLINSPTFDSDNLGSIVFDGTNNYVQTTFQTANYFTKNSPFTVSIWVKLSYKPTSSGDRYALLGSGQWKQAGFSIVTSPIADVSFTINDGDTGTAYSARMSTENWNTNEWMYIVGVFSSNNLSIYKNSNLYMGDVFGEWTTRNDNMRVGWTNQGGYIPMTGNISNIQLYNRALTATEVLQNYNATKARFGL